MCEINRTRSASLASTVSQRGRKAQRPSSGPGNGFGVGCQKEREKSNSCEFQSSLRFFAPTDNESIKVQGGGGACIQAQVQVLAMGVLINKLQNWGLLAGEGLVKTVCYTAVYAAACCIEFLGYFVFYLVVGALSGVSC